jgi:hypothetical protein
MAAKEATLDCVSGMALGVAGVFADLDCGDVADVFDDVVAF